MLNKICTMTAKSAPYPPCTVTAYWLKYQDSALVLRRVTQPPHIAGPLQCIPTTEMILSYTRKIMIKWRLNFSAEYFLELFD
jgi:hypothetical protein